MPEKRVDSLVPVTIPVLIEVARKKEKITYGDLAANIGIHHRVTPIILDRIRQLCIDNSWPPLTAIVINKGTRKPGESLYDPWLPSDSSEDKRISMWDSMLNDVYSFDWMPVLAKYPELR